MAKSKTNNTLDKTRRIVVISLFAASIVVLQLISAYIRIGAFNLTMVLVPVVLSAVLFGTSVSTLMGLFFGIFTFAFCVIGIDPGGSAMFAVRPVLTAVVCIIKGTAAGFLSGVVYSLFNRFSKKGILSIFASALTAPVVNTGIFVIFGVLFYKPLLTEWAGLSGSNLISYVFLTLIATNMTFEVLLNIIVCPVIGYRLKNSKLMRLATK